MPKYPPYPQQREAAGLSLWSQTVRLLTQILGISQAHSLVTRLLDRAAFSQTLLPSFLQVQESSRPPAICRQPAPKERRENAQARQAPGSLCVHVNYISLDVPRPAVKDTRGRELSNVTPKGLPAPGGKCQVWEEAFPSAHLTSSTVIFVSHLLLQRATERIEHNNSQMESPL